MRYKKFHTALFLVLALCFLTNCSGPGGSGSSETPPTPTPSPAPTPTPTPAPPGRPASVFVGNFGASNLPAFPAIGTGNLTPSATITGALNPYLIFMDGTGRLWSANRLLATITAYASGASGNATPVVDIAGSNTGLAIPIDVYVNSTGTIFETDGGDGISGSLRIFAAGANGNVAPAAVISGSNTTFNNGQPGGIWLDNTGNIYVTNFNRATVDIFAPGSSGNVSPSRTISGSNTLFSSPFGITLDSAGNIYVTNPGNQSILVFAAGSSGNVTPSRVISGANTLLSFPAGIAVDAQGYIYVADSNDNAVLVFGPGANGNVAPVQNISGSNTGLSTPRGIAIR